ncbi:MAG: PilZ domain-containing protein [Candidatus Omnitrophica bacterium]|nr:PilZ domain-containing protein [Candidatus Omnitrophota bacterium]
MREKRRFIRFDITLKVTYAAQKAPRAEKTGIVKDVSAGGMQLLTEEKLETGSRLELKMIIPEALNPVHLNGTVLWSRDVSEGKKISYSAGIEFGKIEEDNKNTFLRFLCDLMYRKIGKQ